MKVLTLLSTLLVSVALSQSAFAATQIVPETITIEDELGSINTQRIKSIQTEIRYVPKGDGFSYTIINPSDKGTDLQDEHVDSGELSIPSWTLFNW